jgi:dipeptidyl aminopeptidase/acylaminoacyl peptidase
MIHRLSLLILLCSLSVWASTGQRALTFEDMFSMRRLGATAQSPQGTHMLFEVAQAHVSENKMSQQIFLLDLNKGTAFPVTALSDNASEPAWHPDGQSFFFVKDGQIFQKFLNGRPEQQITTLSGGAWGPKVAPDGSFLLFCSTVSTLPEKPYAHSGLLIDRLMFRHWNRWVFGERTHLFLQDLNKPEAEPVDLTPGEVDVPPLALGSAHDYDISPDSKEIVYVKNTDPVVAISTNNDIFVMNLGTREERRISISKGCDQEPHYSPDGQYIAYTSMAREGFEADRTVVTLFHRKNQTTTALSIQHDRSASDLAWHPSSQSLLYTAMDRGAQPLFSIDLKGNTLALTENAVDASPQFSPDGKTIYFRRQRSTMPWELFQLQHNQPVKQLTQLNTERLKEIEMNPWESFWFDSENGARVQGFVIKPPFFDASRTYPMIYLIHGGPQGMWSNDFHYRWNSQLFAAPGYVVVLVNPHGSKGYGQAFCDAVSKDWGGLPYSDLMRGLDAALTEFPFIDGSRLGAAGASYGGFMINWILGHTDRFSALVSHNGVFNQSSMAGATEELWFPLWEFGGSYYDHPEGYEQWSPHHFVNQFKTPTLVVHSEKDYRVPVNQGIELFTALQRRKVPSQWLYFPDEDHFVRKPLNAKLWWETVHHWFDKYLDK